VLLEAAGLLMPCTTLQLMLLLAGPFSAVARPQALQAQMTSQQQQEAGLQQQQQQRQRMDTTMQAIRTTRAA